MVDVVRRIHRDAPGMALQFRNPSETAAADLEAGEVDFIINPESQHSAAQSGVVIFEDSYVVVVDADNPEIGQSIGIDQYLTQRHVACKSGRHGLPHLETWMASRHGDQRRVDVEAHSFQLRRSPLEIARISRIDYPDAWAALVVAGLGDGGNGDGGGS